MRGSRESEHSSVLGDTFYRYVDPIYAGSDPRLVRFSVVKVTPKGVWITDYFRLFEEGLLELPGPIVVENSRFVLVGGRRAYAYPTKELALNSYRIRKSRQVRHLRRALTRTMDRLNWVEKASGSQVLTKEPTRLEQVRIDQLRAAEPPW